MDVMDEALDLLGNAGPEYGPGFSNHAPMAAEALLALGRGDAAIDWVTAYRKRLPGSRRGTHMFSTVHQCSPRSSSSKQATQSA